MAKAILFVKIRKSVYTGTYFGYATTTCIDSLYNAILTFLKKPSTLVVPFLPLAWELVCNFFMPVLISIPFRLEKDTMSIKIFLIQFTNMRKPFLLSSWMDDSASASVEVSRMGSVPCSSLVIVPPSVRRVRWASTGPDGSVIVIDDVRAVTSADRTANEEKKWRMVEVGVLGTGGLEGKLVNEMILVALRLGR